MCKQCLRIVIAVGLIAIAAPFGAAQSSQTPNDQKSSASSHSAGGRTFVQELTAQLKLTPDQQLKVEDAFHAERSQLESLPRDASLAPQDRRATMIAIHKSTDAQIRALLNATQQKRWDQIETKREQWLDRPSGWTDRRGGS